MTSAKPFTLAEAEGVIERAAWTPAKSTKDLAPHQYVVRGWDRDDLTEEEFWRFVALIKAQGRLEERTPPQEWMRRWGDGG